MLDILCCPYPLWVTSPSFIPFWLLVELSWWSEWVSEVSENCSVVSDSLQRHGLYSPWNSPGQSTGVSSLSLLQGIFPTQGSNRVLHCRQILDQPSYEGSWWRALAKDQKAVGERPVYLLPFLLPHWPQVGSGTASSLAVFLLTFWLYSLQLPFSSVSSCFLLEPDR